MVSTLALLGITKSVVFPLFSAFPIILGCAVIVHHNLPMQILFCSMQIMPPPPNFLPQTPTPAPTSSSSSSSSSSRSTSNSSFESSSRALKGAGGGLKKGLERPLAQTFFQPQPLWQPPTTARRTDPRAASEVPSLLMHPLGGGGGHHPHQRETEGNMHLVSWLLLRGTHRRIWRPWLRGQMQWAGCKGRWQHGELARCTVCGEMHGPTLPNMQHEKGGRPILVSRVAGRYTVKNTASHASYGGV